MKEFNDSLILKKIGDGAVNGIMKLYGESWNKEVSQNEDEL